MKFGISLLSTPWHFGEKTKLESKLAIEKFMSNSLLQGEIISEIRNASHLINLNLLRMARPKIETSPNDRGKKREETDTSAHLNKMILNLEERLVELFRQKFDQTTQRK